MTTSRTIIRFKTITRIGRGRSATKRIGWTWVASVKWADGPGMRVKSVQFSNDRDRACRFSMVQAQEISIQFAHCFPAIEQDNGQESTGNDQLQRDLDEKRLRLIEERRHMNEQIAEMNREFNSIISNLVNR